jgi:septal ring factor EnvC (AmiA/AmiB activator)
MEGGVSILREFASFVQQLFTINKELDRNYADIKQLRQDMQALILRVGQLENRLDMLEEREASEREKLALQLQVALLKFERRLPPARGADEGKKE